MCEPDEPRISHVEGVVVFDDGRSHCVRLTPHTYQQWAAPVTQLGEAVDAIDAMHQALARSLEGIED